MKPSDAVLLTIIIILVVLFASSRSHHKKHFGATDAFCQGQLASDPASDQSLGPAERRQNACVSCQ
jgi:hypothetical protein